MQTVAIPHGTGAASGWVQRWSHLVRPGGCVLDVGCGHGRHVRWFLARQHPVVGIDRDPAAIAALADLAPPPIHDGKPRVQTVLADIENAPWPLMEGPVPRQFDAVIVTNYLWRPLWPVLLDSLARGGVVIYETFAAGNETVGKPSRPDFLLQTGELLSMCAKLRVIAFEEGFIDNPPRFVQRITAAREESDHGKALKPVRYPL